MPANLSSVLDATEPTVFTPGWGRLKGLFGMPEGLSPYARSKPQGWGFREDCVPPECGMAG